MNFIRINEEVLVFWLWSDAFSMARLQVHQIVKQDNKKCSSCLLCYVRNVQLVMVHRYNLLTMSSPESNFFLIVVLPRSQLSVLPRFN